VLPHAWETLAFTGMPELVADLAKIVPRPRETIVLPDCRHRTQQECPWEVNAAMIRFSGDPIPMRPCQQAFFEQAGRVLRRSQQRLSLQRHTGADKRGSGSSAALRAPGH
jgi:hypothetical protein